MQELVDIRARIKTVQMIGSVCGTLATVASARLSKTRDRALATRVYTEAIRGLVGDQLAAAGEAGLRPETLSPLFAVREPTRVLLLVIGTDRGLCGGYNLELDAAARAFLGERREAGIDVRLLVKGSRTERIMRKSAGAEVTAAGPWPRAGVTREQVDEVFDTVRDAFLGGDVDEVWACYPTFLSSISREPRAVRLLPVELPRTASRSILRYFYEPGRDEPLSELLDILALLQVEDAMLEAFASEQAARMVTMQEASERADKTLAELRIRYNRVRRESITSDLTGIMVARRLRTERDRVTT